MSVLAITLIIVALIAAVPVGKVLAVVGSAITSTARSTLGVALGATIAIGGLLLSITGGLGFIGVLIFGLVTLLQRALA